MTASVAEDLRLADFDYELPEELIAQEPARERDRSRLMVTPRASAGVEHRTFSDIVEYLLTGDVLVLNNTRVIPCRLAARKPGGGKAEIFLLAEKERNVWEALVRGGAGTGKRLTVARDTEAEILAELDNGTRLVRFHGIDDIRARLEALGKVPLPPYIAREATDEDRERYQTVYADQDGAVAAPTAGLHFTQSLMKALEAKGVEIVKVTLHVGPGTFQPVRTDRIAGHRMLPEQYSISAEAAAAVNRAKVEGRRVISVGTTSVRALETASRETGVVAPGNGSSELFIAPGYRFKIVDGLITNFHLPKSTLLMLVSAFAGRERMLDAYRIAVRERYRFYSYGDAMFIV